MRAAARVSDDRVAVLDDALVAFPARSRYRLTADRPAFGGRDASGVLTCVVASLTTLPLAVMDLDHARMGEPFERGNLPSMMRWSRSPRGPGTASRRIGRPSAAGTPPAY